MLVHSLLVVHIVVLGYWLGAEFVINSTYRYVCFHGELPFDDRQRLMDHVRCVDQHVRYALVLQAGLGTALGCLLGYFPGGGRGAAIALAFAFVWLIYVEVVHRLRYASIYPKLATVDRGTRYGLMVFLATLWGGTVFGTLSIDTWLAWKLLCFAGVMLCGVGIRLQGIKMARVWAALGSEGSTPEREQSIQSICIRATTILGILWLFIGAITVLSVTKPGLG